MNRPDNAARLQLSPSRQHRPASPRAAKRRGRSRETAVPVRLHRDRSRYVPRLRPTRRTVATRRVSRCERKKGETRLWTGGELINGDALLGRPRIPTTGSPSAADESTLVAPACLVPKSTRIAPSNGGTSGVRERVRGIASERRIRTVVRAFDEIIRRTNGR